MEAMGEWTGMYTSCTTEEADFINQLLASYDGGSSTISGGLWNVGSHEHSLSVNTAPFYNSVDGGAAGFCSFSQESSSYSCGGSGYYTVAAVAADENNENNGGSSMDFGMDRDVTIGTRSYLVAEETSHCNVYAEEYSGKICCGGRGGGHEPLETVVESHDENLQPEISVTTDQKSLGHSESSKKRSRASSTEKNKRNTKARRNQKRNNDGGGGEGDNDEGGEEEEDKARSKAALNRRSSNTTTCCSEDDSSSKVGGGSTALNLNGNTRASRGAATDPQSLYARKRRERINERLRILQSLVPNGTKVDISTMLEEAVQYVKFLQLQIKLLSSDDLWMYAPIAYNGMDIGLDLKLNVHR